MHNFAGLTLLQLINFYQILNIKPEANLLDIKKAYHRMAKVYHPDVSKDPNANARFQKINEAYRILANPKTRRLHDFKISQYTRKRYGSYAAGRNIDWSEHIAYTAARKRAQAHYAETQGKKYVPGRVDKLLFASLLIIGVLAIILGIIDIVTKEAGEPLNLNGVVMGLFFSLILIYGWRLLTRK